MFNKANYWKNRKAGKRGQGDANKGKFHFKGTELSKETIPTNHECRYGIVTEDISAYVNALGSNKGLNRAQARRMGIR